MHPGADCFNVQLTVELTDRPASFFIRRGRSGGFSVPGLAAALAASVNLRTPCGLACRGLSISVTPGFISTDSSVSTW